MENIMAVLFERYFNWAGVNTGIVLYLLNIAALIYAGLSHAGSMSMLMLLGGIFIVMTRPSL